MFDFEKLEVYQRIRAQNKKLIPFTFTLGINEGYLKDQLGRAGLSVLLNLSEGTGRMSDADKKQFYIRSRSSVFECVSIIQTLMDLNKMEKDFYEDLYNEYEGISKMLLGMIRSLKN